MKFIAFVKCDEKMCLEFDMRFFVIEIEKLMRQIVLLAEVKYYNF